MMVSFSKDVILTLSLVLFLSSFATARDPDGREDDKVTNRIGGAFGDPHFRMWSGESYDFHGVCDLVLLANSDFAEGLGMDVHVRSKKMNKMFSYMDGASVRIGADVFEVKGGRPDEQASWVNGVATTGDEAVSLSGKYPVVFEDFGGKSKKFTIKLGGDEAIMIQTWNAMVRVSFINARSEDFGRSQGMMGAFPTGEKLARDGITFVNDFNKFGLEWQVLPTEPKLFREVGGVPRSPETCEIPSSVEMRRRLGEVSMTAEKAEIACSQVEPALFDMCVFDVLVSDDKSLVGAY